MMTCEKCGVGFHDDWVFATEWTTRGGSPKGISTWSGRATICPNCGYLLGAFGRRGGKDDLLPREVRTYGHDPVIPTVSEEVPQRFKDDFGDAHAVLKLSPKAAAGLARRILEAIFREQGYAQDRLVDQINAVLGESDQTRTLPTELNRIVDAVRKFGNFSAHEKMNAKEMVIDVEPGEAEWCLEIVEQLFDHYYVKPAENSRKLADLGAKLQEARESNH